MNNNDALRLARVEAVCNGLRAQMDDVQEQLYTQACSEQDEELAAQIIRTKRNKLLTESDARMCLDRCLPTAPTGKTITAWLQWLQSLADVASNRWAAYRQELRDITAQEGFPFEVEFPEKPEEN